MASKLRSGRILLFWKEVKSPGGKTRVLPHNIDGILGYHNIAELCSSKYSNLIMTAPEEICLYVGQFSNGKSCGIDCIPAGFFKHDEARVFQLLFRFVNGVMCHSHIPRLLNDILLKTVVKSTQKNPTDSRNYRPLAAPTSVSN